MLYCMQLKPTICYSGAMIGNRKNDLMLHCGNHFLAGLDGLWEDLSYLFETADATP